MSLPVEQHRLSLDQLCCAPPVRLADGVSCRSSTFSCLMAGRALPTGPKSIHSSSSSSSSWSLCRHFSAWAAAASACSSSPRSSFSHRGPLDAGLSLRAYGPSHFRAFLFGLLRDLSPTTLHRFPPLSSLAHPPPLLSYHGHHRTRGPADRGDHSGVRHGRDGGTNRGSNAGRVRRSNARNCSSASFAALNNRHSF
eukprot:GHVS01072697.1.p1 GENE.GHVS01072697.1~~GHVS01072697.1.p1  ORF type:complete len:196 (+),score=28.58 GHVS01072697.1:186-773(+)